MKWTSTVPIAIEAPPGLVFDCQTMPICLAKLKTLSGPSMIAALIAGMLSESWIASRRRTGPRSVRSASPGA